MADKLPTSVYKNTSADEFGGFALKELVAVGPNHANSPYHLALAQVYATLAQAKAFQEAVEQDSDLAELIKKL